MDAADDIDPLAGMMDLNSWPVSRLRTFAECIKGLLFGDGFQLPPDHSDLAFWTEVASKVGGAPTEEYCHMLAETALSAIEKCDPTCLRPSSLYIANMSVPDSRLAIARLGIKGVVVVGGSVNEVPAEDGVNYHVHPVLPSASSPEERAAQLALSVDFARRHQPALVCSDLGDGLSAVICAAILASSQSAAQSSGNVAADGLRAIEVRRGPLAVESDDVDALENYCARLPIALRTPPSRPKLIHAKPPPFSITATKRPLEESQEEVDDDDGPITPTEKKAVARADAAPGNVKARLLGRVVVPPPSPISADEFSDEAADVSPGPEVRKAMGMLAPPPAVCVE